MKRHQRLFALSALLAAGLLAPSPGSAGIIRSAVEVVNAPPAVNTDPRERTDPNSVIDQSGLTMGYVDGVTDFATYIAQAPAHDSTGPDDYFAGFSPSPDRPIDFDLGASFGILQLALWNYPLGSRGAILDFEVYTANTVDFLDAMLVGSFTALNDGGGEFLPQMNGVQVFDLLDTNARYLRIRVLTSVDLDEVFDLTNSFTLFGLSEVAFDTGPVSSTEIPEPGTVTLMLTGLGALILRRRSAGNA